MGRCRRSRRRGWWRRNRERLGRRRRMAELRGSSGDAPHHVLTRWFGTPDLHTLDVYESKAGGYNALRKALYDMAPPDITNAVNTSGLRARGRSGIAPG